MLKSCHILLEGEEHTDKMAKPMKIKKDKINAEKRSKFVMQKAGSKSYFTTNIKLLMIQAKVKRWSKFQHTFNHITEARKCFL